LQILLSLLIAFCLISCKVSVDTEIDISDLSSGKVDEIAGDLYVEVTTCNDFEDSRKPSDSLLEAQQIVPSILKGSQYIECFQKQFNSYARFKIPITIDRVKDGKLASENNIMLVSNESILLGVQMPTKMKDGMKDVERRSFGVNKLDNIKFNIKITNRNKKPFNYVAHSVFLNGDPHVGSKQNNSGKPIEVTLSDVSVAQALDGRLSPVLFLAN